MPPKRLLDTATGQLVDWDKRSSPQAQYAILSHRWRDEITFEDFRGLPNHSLGSMRLDARYERSKKKLIGACRLAKGAGIPYLWADTACIDKSNSEELSRSLRSMYHWYREATVCYAFLDDIRVDSRGDDVFRRTVREGEKTVEELKGERPGDAKTSVWFTRGWTLQELLAPRTLDFFDQDWDRVDSRSRLTSQIQRITGIDKTFLQGDNNLDEVSIATKMSWMAGRTTSLVEDIAYSLIGLFDVSVPPIYGEGIKAFTRLQETLLQDASFDESLFAWKSDVPLKCFGRDNTWKVDEWGLLAPSPDCFATSRDIAKAASPSRLAGGFHCSSQGITVHLPIKETKNLWGIDKKQIPFPLNCSRQGETIVLELARERKGSTAWRRRGCSAQLIPDAKAKVGNNQVWGIDQVLTAQVTVAHQYYRG